MIFLAITERVNHEGVFEFLRTCKWWRVERVIPEFIYLAVMSFIAQDWR